MQDQSIALPCINNHGTFDSDTVFHCRQIVDNIGRAGWLPEHSEEVKTAASLLDDPSFGGDAAQVRGVITCLGLNTAFFTQYLDKDGLLIEEQRAVFRREVMKTWLFQRLYCASQESDHLGFTGLEGFDPDTLTYPPNLSASLNQWVDVFRTQTHYFNRFAFVMAAMMPQAGSLAEAMDDSAAPDPMQRLTFVQMKGNRLVIHEQMDHLWGVMGLFNAHFRREGATAPGQFNCTSTLEVGKDGWQVTASVPADVVRAMGVDFQDPSFRESMTGQMGDVADQLDAMAEACAAPAAAGHQSAAPSASPSIRHKAPISGVTQFFRRLFNPPRRESKSSKRAHTHQRRVGFLREDAAEEKGGKGALPSRLRRSASRPPSDRKTND